MPKDERVEFTGKNGKDVADRLSDSLGIEVLVGEVMGDGSLSLDQFVADKLDPRFDQQLSDRWRVPVGHFIDLTTGAVYDVDGNPCDYAELVKGKHNGQDNQS